jgi:hypothetical protein
MRGRPRASLPDDFAAFAAAKGIQAVVKHYGVAHRAANRWFREAGIKPTPAAERLIPVPRDFEGRALTMFLADLIEHYRKDRRTIRRWANECGIQLLVKRRPKSKEPRHIKTPAVKQIRPNVPAARIAARDTSREGEAADFIRRRGFVVYRCTLDGRASYTGRYWRVGIGEPITGQHLIARAEAKGFQQERWAA